MRRGLALTRFTDGMPTLCSSTSSSCPSLRKDPTGRKEKAMAAGLLPWGAQFQESATLKDVCGFHLGRVDSSSLCSEEAVWERDTGELQECALAGVSPFQTRCDFSAGVRRTEPDAKELPGASL
ncbi:hypothetical protein HJG60_011998 [Phyllostomus discolor]|uniref:Uncharacterized protein n=1 Tax=Phyllostomus discolor TaxID=89673 RepID=A0A833ZJ36_9CHIR|nr:hypothetical protein HJG60_011998 [Phyllostomus discolor]